MTDHYDDWQSIMDACKSNLARALALIQKMEGHHPTTIDRPDIAELMALLRAANGSGQELENRRRGVPAPV